MRIAILSDQHGSLPPIPVCDLVILSGDICGGPEYIRGVGWLPELSNDYWRRWLETEFANWARTAPHIIAVAGNHDTAIERHGFPRLDGVEYLQDSGTTFGGLRFWGSPWTRLYDELAFNVPEKRMRRAWDMIPSDTDVLVCHMPPFGAGDLIPPDKRLGCPYLAEAIRRIKPRLMTCGHIHEGRGIYQIIDTIVVNSSLSFTEIGEW